VPHPGDLTRTATTALLYENLERATAGLRAELRRQLLAADVQVMPAWKTFVVTGPRAFTDLAGALGTRTGPPWTAEDAGG